MSSHSIRDIAQALGADFKGTGDLLITAASEPANAGPEHLAVAMDPKYGDAIGKGKAQAAILWQGADWRAYGLKAAVFVRRPRPAMAALTGYLQADAPAHSGIHARAEIDPSAKIHADCTIAPFVVIGAGVCVGKGARIGAHATLSAGVVIGTDCMLGAAVNIGHNVIIGDRFIAHPGVVIGADGFSFVAKDAAAPDAGQPPAQEWQKIQSLGGVRIGDDVEIGANSNVDAGTIRPTSVGDGSKIDALVQVGHNVRIGRNCLLCAHVAVGGSATLGDGVVLGGQAGVADNITVADGVVAGGASKILSNIPAGRMVLGYPAVLMEQHFASYKALRRLPGLLRKLKKAEIAVSKDGGRD